MNRSQNGFSILPLLVLTIIITVVGTLFTYIGKSNKPIYPAAKSTYTHTDFKLVKIETSNWQTYSPLTNFTFKYPTQWSLEDEGQFKQPSSGDPDNLNPSYVTLQEIHLVSNDATAQVLNGNTQELNLDTIKTGAKVSLMITFGNNMTTKGLCDYYIHKKVDYFTSSLGEMCQIQLQKNYYTFMLGKNGNVYRTSLLFNINESSQNKDQFISIAREIVKSYSFNE